MNRVAFFMSQLSPDDCGARYARPARLGMVCVL